MADPHFRLHVCVCEIYDTWTFGDMELIFPCSIYNNNNNNLLTGYVHHNSGFQNGPVFNLPFMADQSEHSKINSISPRAHVLFSISLQQRFICFDSLEGW